MVKTLMLSALLVGSAGAAYAAPQAWDFSYVATTGTLTGRVEGTLQADGNTIFASGVTGVKFNGTPGPALVNLNSVSAIYWINTDPPTLTLDGSLLNFYADSLNGDSILFDSPGLVGQLFFGFSLPFVASSTSYGGINDSYNAANWSISAVPAVPEPSSWAMLIAGFGLVGAMARRRRPAVAHAA